MIPDITGKIRILAKSNYWQTTYSASKEIGIELFENKRDLTSIQSVFINLLGFYDSLFTDIVLQEIDDIVLKNEIYEDAYMYYRRKKQKKDDTFKGRIDSISPNKTQWVFTKPKK